MEEMNRELSPEEQAQVSGGYSPVQEKRLESYRRRFRDAEPGSEEEKLAAQKLAEYRKQINRLRH